MQLLTQLYTSLLRIILLLIGVMIAFYIGSAGFQSINGFLSDNNLPCIEVISSLVIIVPTVALFYGQHIKKYFWQRMVRFNLIILISSLLIGLLFAILPPDLIPQDITNCASRIGVMNNITYGLGTAVITALLAFIGFDLGVTLKHLSLRLTSLHSGTITKKKRRKKR